jgi:hypothetical protein
MLTVLLLATLLSADPPPGTIRALAGDAKHTYGASVYLCYYAEGRTKLEAALADEKKATQIGGVVNKSETYRLSKNLVDLEKAEKQVRSSLKGKPLACTAPGIRHLVDCLHASDAGWAGGECMDDADWEAFREAFVD